ncbi:MAG: hypothetical protein O7G85_16560, partial [Planctomycetota bacterium]|nr:hypothetical protein [Planctomycetota bacterium]
MTMYLVVIGILLCSASLLIVTRSWFIVWLVRPELEKRLGGPVLIEKASYQGDGGFVFQNIALDAPNIVGPAKNLVEIERVEVRLDPEALFDGEVVLTYVEISGLHLRLSENRNQAGEMNFMSLTPMWDSQATMLPPTVQINDVTIQVGMHDGVSFQNMGHRVFSGSMHPLEDHPSWFGFTLDEFDAETGTTGTGNLRINGQWDASTLAFTSDVSGLELSPETHSMCPSLVRFWWEQMDLEGSVHRMQVTYEPGQQMEIEMDLLDVALSLPIDTEGMWSVYHNGKAHLSDESPRMHVDRGVVELALDRLVLRNLEGTIGERIVDGVQVGLPFEGSFRIASLPDFDWANRDQWLDQVLNEAPFELEFRIVDFKVFPDEDGETREVKLPTSIAKLFERFNMTQWELDSRFVLQRGTFDDGSNPPDSIELRTEGDIFLSHARGAFGPFPYPLHDVKAHVMINNDEARILELTALGEGDSVVELTGRIAPLSRNPSVKIDLVARNLTTSDILRQALNEKQRAIYDAFFHDASHEALLRSGALDDATQFEYGGMLDLTLHFDRPPGPDQSLVITGEADIDRIGVIHDNFPYPVTVEGGRITIEEDRIALHGLDDDPGLSILMAGGGQGFVSGEIRFLRTDGKLEVRPELRLAVQGDTFSQLLYTSIPMASSERALLEDQSDWPGQALSRTSRLLKGMGPTGLLNYEGDLYLDEHGRFDYEFMVHLAGSATPGEALADAIGTAGLIWPEGFSLDHVEGDLRVTRDRIELKQLTGQQDRTRVSASGSIDLREGINDTTIHVTFEQLELGPYLINLAPSESADQVREFWNRYQPHGHFGLDLEYRVTDDEDVLTLEVMPENIGFTLDGQPVRLMHEGGDILLMDKIVQFNELGLRLFSNDRNDGSILLNG